MIKTSIAFVDDHPLMLDGLQFIFSAMDDYDVVGQGCSADDAISLTKAKKPNMILIDLNMPGDAFEAIRHIAGSASGTRVVAFTAIAGVDCAVRALESGASGYLLKGSTADEMILALDAIKAGETYITPSLASKVINSLREARRRDLPSQKFSMREGQILSLLQTGLSNKEIARELQISDKTVRYYMTLMMRKLNARNRVEVVIAAQQMAPADNPAEHVWN
jgi:two-component system, NarL family, nitrate/nitrite response regulator NarL